MGLLTGLGTIGSPLGTPRFTEALAAGLYARTNASLIYPDETKQVIAFDPDLVDADVLVAVGRRLLAGDGDFPSDQQLPPDRGHADRTVTTSGIWTSAHGESASFKYQDGGAASRLQAAGAGVDLRSTPAS